MSRFDLERFEPPPDEEFICCICRGILDKPMETPCRHVFCKTCIETWLQNGDNQSCPTCRSPLTLARLFTALPLLNNLINKLKLNCLNRENGCTETWLIENFSSEHEKTCEYRNVTCRYEKCKNQTLAKNIARHEEKCEHRPYTCKKICGLTITAKEKASHSCGHHMKATIVALQKALESKDEELERLKAKNELLQGLIDRSQRNASERSNNAWIEQHESDDERNSMRSLLEFFLRSPSDHGTPSNHQSSDHSASLSDSMVGFSEGSENDDDDDRVSVPTSTSTFTPDGDYDRRPSPPRSYDSDLDHMSRASASPLGSRGSVMSNPSREGSVSPLYGASPSPSRDSVSPPCSPMYRQSPVGSVDSRTSYVNRRSRKRRRIAISTSSGDSSDSSIMPSTSKRMRSFSYDSPGNVFVTDSDEQTSDSADSTSESQDNYVV